MKVIPVNPFIPPQMQTGPASPVQTGKAQPDFAGILKDALNDVNNLQIKADDAVQSLVLGQTEDIHSVMISVEQAKLAMQLTVQVRNKLIEAYQEISRMQI